MDASLNFFHEEKNLVPPFKKKNCDLLREAAEDPPHNQMKTILLKPYIVVINPVLTAI
jgi:hypothetical protein